MWCKFEINLILVRVFFGYVFFISDIYVIFGCLGGRMGDEGVSFGSWWDFVCKYFGYLIMFCFLCGSRGRGYF